MVKEKPGLLKGDAGLFVDTEVYNYDSDVCSPILNCYLQFSHNFCSQSNPCFALSKVQCT